MSTWVVGDIQGCLDALQRLVQAIDFVPGRDVLWLAGDLVNRGPDSLGVLRWAHAHRDHVRIVLGNHDLHLLARAVGVAAPKRRDTLDAVLTAPDRVDLLDWLASQPLVWSDSVANQAVLMVHAGLLPHWTRAEVLELAGLCHKALSGAGRVAFLAAVADAGRIRDPETAKLVHFVAGVTRVRCVTPVGGIVADFSGEPAQAPPGAVPWFAVPHRATANDLVVAGHWAAAGLRLYPKVILTDSGCVWGQRLSAVRLEDRKAVQVDAQL
jgi:bis(5'-nucleosyl)-tetraphosphatase (symmetrical)